MAGEGNKEEPSSTEDFILTAQKQLTDMNEAGCKAVDEAGGFSDTADGSTDNTAAIDLFLCPNCGVEIVVDATTTVTYCYYCHSPVVLSGRLSRKLLPDKVLLFVVEEEKTISRFPAWTKKKQFVPKVPFNKDQIDKSTGVYSPYQATDAEVDDAMQANGTIIRIWRMGDIGYTEAKQLAVLRAGKLSFKELIKNVLSKNT